MTISQLSSLVIPVVTILGWYVSQLSFLAIPAVTILGWYVVNYLTSRRERLAREIDLRKKYIERQIEELYGPLFNLTHQVKSLNEIKEDITKKKWELEGKDLRDDEVVQIRRFIRVECVWPIHEKMNLIMNTNSIFLMATRCPKPFYN